MNKKTKNNGITLISLVITIVLMLILAGVTIKLVVTDGLFDYASNAVGDTRNAMEQEQELINDIMNNHIKPHTKKDEETTLEAPTLTVTSGTPGNNGWYKSNVTVTITPQSEADTIKYKIEGKQTQSETVGKSVTITAEGESTITAYAYNEKGEKSDPATIKIKKDSQKPSCSFVTTNGEIQKITWSITNLQDNCSNNLSVKMSYKLNTASVYTSNMEIQAEKGGELSGTITNLQNDNTYTVKLEVEDEAGNILLIEKETTTYTTQCFVAGTKVLTENGLKNIEEIQVGEKVYALNIDNNAKELKEVISLYRGYSNEIYEIKVGDKLIEATPKHQFYIVDKGWIRARELEIGDELVAKGTSEKMVISDIKYVYYEEPVAVYNLKIDDYHNYLITEYNLLVHNGLSASLPG